MPTTKLMFALRGTRSWRDYAEEAYDAMWNTQPDLVSKMPVHNHKSSDTASFIKHVHLPRSIWAARITKGVWYRGNCMVTIDVVLCSGCCQSPLHWETFTTDWNGVETPGPMQEAGPSSPKYGLYMDGVQMQLLHFPDIQIELGDYGHCSPTFERNGNIFQDLAAGPAYDPIKRKVSSETMVGDIVTVLASAGGDLTLDLRQPAGLSLPNNQELVSLLKALSLRLVDKCLVTSVVRVRPQLGGTNTPLCYLSIPQVWRRDTFDIEQRARFKKIREQFYTLSNWSRPMTSAGDRRSPNNKTTTKAAIKYFSDLFGIEHFESYFGKITFFKELSVGRVPSPDSGTPGEEQDPFIAALTKTLCVKHEIGAISKTLGIKLLEEMALVYSEAGCKLRKLKCNLDENSSRHVEFRAMVEEINDLQKKLDGTENNDDQLALEEDITGRILWACHSGLRSTVGHIPAMVLNSTLKDDKMYHLLDRVKFLDEICTIFNDALAELPTDDQAHLRRIMSDAEAGTSKYQLLQDERAREQRTPGATGEGQTTT
ncbi:hypothetical protein EDC04DRAFT_1028175 [Pisolithus marmoratus]|nr:hypothetical protein EDC04DRAFT_1028175 [Pisolithus marmoratus]